MIICLCLLFAGRASAQWVVSDPGNLAQGITMTSKNIIHTSKTATNMVSNFQENGENLSSRAKSITMLSNR